MSPMHSDAAVDILGTTEPSPDPIAHERCDRCGARAHVVTLHGPGMPLSWCGHHFGRHERALTATAGVVVMHDTRDRLVPTQRQAA